MIKDTDEVAPAVWEDQGEFALKYAQAYLKTGEIMPPVIVAFKGDEPLYFCEVNMGGAQTQDEMYARVLGGFSYGAAMGADRYVLATMPALNKPINGLPKDEMVVVLTIADGPDNIESNVYEIDKETSTFAKPFQHEALGGKLNQMIYHTLSYPVEDDLPEGRVNDLDLHAELYVLLVDSQGHDVRNSPSVHAKLEELIREKRESLFERQLLQLLRLVLAEDDDDDPDSIESMHAESGEEE